MARIAGIELNDNWKLDYALTRIRGIGWPLSRSILAKTGIDATKRLVDITNEDLAKIAVELEAYPLEGELARKVRGDIARLAAIGTYRGIRHQKNLPVRGQRTRSNARSKRGKRKTVGAYKKETLSQMKDSKPAEEKK